MEKKTVPRWLRGKIIPLNYSKHSLQRLEERSKGSLLIRPTTIKITEESLLDYWKNSSRKLILKVKIKYNRKYNLILILQMDGTVKTLYYDFS